MITSPLVTCAFTVFNAESSIHEALLSAIAQSYRPIEILIVDDCSSDNSVRIINSLISSSDLSITLLTNDNNMGVAYCRNVLLNNANGEYISFFDDDDISFPCRVFEQMMYLQKFDLKHNILLFSDRIILNMHNRELTYCEGIDIVHNSTFNSLHSLLSCRPLNIKSINGSSATCTLTASVDFLKKIGGFDSYFRRYEDLDISVRTLIYSGNLNSIHQPLVYQQFTPSSSKSKSWLYNLMSSTNVLYFNAALEIFNFLH